MDGLNDLKDIEREAPRLFAHLSDFIRSDEAQRTVHSRVLFGPTGTPISQPIAKPGEF